MDEPTTQDVQAQSEGVVSADYVEFLGSKFRLADGVSIMPLMAFANAGKRDLDSETMEGLAALYSLVRSIVYRPALFHSDGTRMVDDDGKPLRDESEWRRFSELAEDELADDDDIMGFVNGAMEVLAARPRKRREISSGSSPQTSERSRPVSSSPVTHPQADGLTPVADLGR